MSSQLASVTPTSADIVLEPSARNTAPAIAAAACLARAESEDPVMVVMPADHIIGAASVFCDAVALAATISAEQAMIATFGINPTHPETGFSYIQRGRALPTGAYELARLVEKPALAVAQDLVSGGEHYCNAGIFVARASVFRAAIAQCAPAISLAAKTAVAAPRRDGQFVRLGLEQFSTAPSGSLDVAVMEKLTTAINSTTAIVVPLAAKWSDIGSRGTLLDVLATDEFGNVSRGGALTIDSHDCVHLSTSRLVTSLGTQGLVIVETPDAVCVAPK